MSKLFSEAQRRMIFEHYADTKTSVLGEALDLTEQQIYAFAKRNGLNKSEAYLASPDACRLRRGDEVGKAYRFQKGIVPANKGLRRPGWTAGNMATTQFKKGVHSGNWLPLGSHRINADGYLDRKVADTGYPPDDWKAVHRLLWIAANGPIPENHVIRFKPDCRTNVLEQITLEILECVSRADMARANSIHRMPPELQDLYRLRGQLTRAINRKAKES